MCMGGAPKMPALPPPEPPREAPRMTDQAARKAYDDSRQAQRSAAGRGGQIRTDLAAPEEAQTAKRMLG